MLGTSSHRLCFGLPLALFSLAALLVAVATAQGAEERVTIDPEVLQAVSGGSARVLVELRVPSMRPEGALNPEAARAQRQAIAAAESAVLSRLSGSRFSLIRGYETVPLLLLEVHDDAVRALEGMGDVVTRVRLDSPIPPTNAGSQR